jgi:ABC-2 type transport system permease protein
MIRLLFVELTRLRWRRAVLVLVATSVLLPALIWVGIAWGTRPVSDSELQHAQEMVDEETSTPRFQREIERCVRHPERYMGRAEGTEQDCLDAIGPQVGWYLSRNQLELADVVSGGLVPVAVIVIGLLMLVGTTFAGADWNSGSMSNQLLFEPRRLRVWWAKAGAVMVAAAITASVAIGGFWGSLVLLAASRDISTPQRVFDRALGIGERGVLFAIFAALGAYAMTMFFRSTVASLGLMFGMVVAATFIIEMLGVNNIQRFALHNNAGAVLLDGLRYYVQPPDSCALESNPLPAECRGQRTLTMWGGVRYFGTLLALAIGSSMWSFRRRDLP